MDEVKNWEITEIVNGIMEPWADGWHFVNTWRFRVVSTYENWVKHWKEVVYYDDYFETDFENYDEYWDPIEYKVENKVRSELYYVNWKREWKYIEMDEDGELSITANYKNWELDGMFYTHDIFWYIKSKVNFVNWKKEWEEIIYHWVRYIDKKYKYYKRIKNITNYVHWVKHGKETEYEFSYDDSNGDNIEKWALIWERNYVNWVLEWYTLRYFKNWNE